MDIASKIMLVASILMMGYNISEFLASYQSLSEKATDLKEIASENGAGEMAMRRSNFLLSFLVDLLPLFLLLCAEIRVTTTWDEPGKGQQG